METLSVRALCSLDDVKQYINLETDVDQDELLIRLINAASEAIYTISNREFKVEGSNPQTRTFDAWDVYANGLLYIGDFQAVTAVSVYNANDELVKAMSLSDVTLYPRNPKPWEPYKALRLRNQTLYYDYYLTVAGTWGFPSVPEEVRQACIVTVGVWHARDIADFGATFSITQDRVELPRTIPPHVADTVSRYAGVGLG